MKIKYSALVSETSGKLNGSVAAKNKGGAYLRNKVTPTNPQTAAQNLVRNRLTTFAQSWRMLSQAEISSWNAAVNNFKKSGSFGDQLILSGSQLYQSINNNLAIAGQAPITLPPLPSGCPALTALAVATMSDIVMTVSFAPTPVPDDTSLIIEATKGVSPGISNANNLFRYIATVAAAGTSPANTFAAYVAKFGTPVPGEKVFVRAYQINNITGERSLYLSAVKIVS